MKFLNALVIQLAVCLVAMLPVAADAGDLIAIVVADTLPREANMGREQDVLRVVDELQIIADCTQMRLNLRVFVDEDYNAQLLHRLEHLSVEPDDVVFFYYSGHGYREENKDWQVNPWPNLLLGFEDRGIDHRMITEILAVKNPRLLLSLANCCNKRSTKEIPLIHRGFGHSDVAVAGSLLEPKPTAVSELQRHNYGRLFLDCSGVIVSSSAMPEQYSFRRPKAGTIYLDAFLSALHKEVEVSAEADWELIFQRTGEMTVAATKGRQNPQYELCLRK